MTQQETVITPRDLDTLTDHFSGLAAKIASGEYVMEASFTGGRKSEKNDSFLSYAPTSNHWDDGTLDVAIRPAQGNAGSTIQGMSFHFRHHLFWVTYPNGSTSQPSGSLATDFRIAATGGEVYTYRDHASNWTPHAGGNALLRDIRDMGLKKVAEDQKAAQKAAWEAGRPERERRALTDQQQAEARVNGLKGSLRL